MSFNPFPQAAPDFSDPLGLIRACHGRIEDHCNLLKRLLPHLAQKGADVDARAAMARIHRYFATAAPHHHEDEELDLFPLLRGRDAGLDGLIKALTREHVELAAHWAALEPLLAVPELAAAAGNSFAAVVERFVASYSGHANKENGHLLPRAAELLGKEELERLGQAMALRRSP